MLSKELPMISFKSKVIHAFLYKLQQKYKRQKYTIIILLVTNWPQELKELAMQIMENETIKHTIIFSGDSNE